MHPPDNIFGPLSAMQIIMWINWVTSVRDYREYVDTLHQEGMARMPSLTNPYDSFLSNHRARMLFLKTWTNVSTSRRTS